jgi:steroid delta-isomerase-like uncharacterized protein
MIGILLVNSLITMANANELKINNILDNYIEAWNEHNIKKIDSFYAKDVIWYDLGYDYTTKGKKEVSKAITNAFLGYVPNMYWNKSGDIFISGNTIIYEWVYGGTYNGKWGDIAVKNKEFQIKGMSSTTINQNGKIVAHKDYYDIHSFKKQLGLVK